MSIESEDKEWISTEDLSAVRPRFRMAEEVGSGLGERQVLLGAL